MSESAFTNVSVMTQANISYDGRCSSHTMLFEDGSKKMLGVILPNDDSLPEYVFQPQSAERIEILSGRCQVKFNEQDGYLDYHENQAFIVAGDSSYAIKTNNVLQYICHLEG